MLILKLADNFYAFCVWITGGIYKIAAGAFEVFIILSTGQVLEKDTYQIIIDNFYIVLGVVVLFFLAFSLLKGMVNPEDSKQGTTLVKNTIINLVTSVAMLAVLPTVFGFLYDFQTSFITRYNVIGRFFGYGSINADDAVVDSDTRQFVEQGAYKITNGVFTAFMNVNMDVCSSSGLEECQEEIHNKTGVFRRDGELSFKDAIDTVNLTGEFRTYDEFSANVTDGEVEFHWFLSIIAGLLLIYVAVSFCFDMGIRMVKLVFYQVIAPIPILSRVVPDGPLKGSFENWVKLVLACYLEVYIRVFAFYFALWLCLALYDAPFLSNISEFNFLIRLLTRAFLFMGIFAFMKQAPKLLSDVTGLDSGNMKLGIRDKLKDGGFFAAGSAVGAGVTGLTRNATNAVGNIKKNWSSANGLKGKAKLIAGGVGSTIGGGIGGAFRGGKAGWGAGSFSDMVSAAGKGAKETIDARDKRAMYKARHEGTAIGVVEGKISDTIDSVQRWAGINNIQALQEEKAAIQKVTNSMDAVTDATKNMLRSEINGKGKNWSFGINENTAEGRATISDSRYGENFQYGFSAKNYRNLSDALDRAKTSGKEVEFNGRMYTADQLQRMFGKYESDYSKALANQLLKSDNDYKLLLRDLEAKYTVNGVVDRAKLLDEVALLNSQRGIAETFKHDLERAVGSGLLSIANDQAREINISDPHANDGLQITSDTVNGSIKINNGAVDRIGAAAKQRTGEIDAEVSKIQQKEADKNGK